MSIFCCRFCWVNWVIMLRLFIMIYMFRQSVSRMCLHLSFASIYYLHQKFMFSSLFVCLSASPAVSNITRNVWANFHEHDRLDIVQRRTGNIFLANIGFYFHLWSGCLAVSNIMDGFSWNFQDRSVKIWNIFRMCQVHLDTGFFERPWPDCSTFLKAGFDEVCAFRYMKLWIQSPFADRVWNYSFSKWTNMSFIINKSPYRNIVPTIVARALYCGCCFTSNSGSKPYYLLLKSTSNRNI